MDSTTTSRPPDNGSVLILAMVKALCFQAIINLRGILIIDLSVVYCACGVNRKEDDDRRVVIVEVRLGASVC